MTSGQRYTPTEHWYHPPPDRSAVGQKKIEELHRQLAAMKHDINDKQNMVEKLKRIQEMEQEKRNAEEKVLERNSRQGTPRLLKSEMERLYGKDSPLDRERGSPALDRHVVETMIKHRTKEYSARQQESTLKAKYLDKERLRLQEARRRIEEQRLALLHAQSPTGKPGFPYDRDIYHVNDQPYHHFSGREARLHDSLALYASSSELTLCSVCKSPTPVELHKCTSCLQPLEGEDYLPVCNYCKYTMPQNRSPSSVVVHHEHHFARSDSPREQHRSQHPSVPKPDSPGTVKNDRETVEKYCLRCRTPRRNKLNPETKPKSYDIPKGEKLNVKVKFVPVPAEENAMWLRYGQRKTKEAGDVVDSAVRAFQSFTDKRKRARRANRVRVNSNPEYRDIQVNSLLEPEQEMTSLPVKGMMGTNNRKYKYPRNQRVKSHPGDIPEDSRFIAVHEYYTPRDNKKEKKEIDRHMKTTTYSEPLPMSYSTVNMYQTGAMHYKYGAPMENGVKIKYRAIPAYGYGLPETSDNYKKQR